MKIVVFADKSYTFVKPKADGIVETLRDMGCDVDVWYDGNYWLNKVSVVKSFFLDIYRLYKNIMAQNRNLYLYRFWSLLTFYSKKRKKALKECDVIIVVSNCPSIFMPNSFPRLDYLRKQYNKPIVIYDSHFLPNQGWWKYISMKDGHYGLERYDWYLVVGLVREFAIPVEIPKIYHEIGMDITSEELKPEQDEFIALVDFKRDNQAENYSMVISTLEELGIKYIALDGKYTKSQIRSIYRKCAIYFVNFRESFGLPIVELQLCGAKIFTPSIDWCPAHFLDKSLYVESSGKLGSNFVCYENDREILKEKILMVKEQFNPQKVLDSFKKEYPNYYRINREELCDFLSKVKSGEINSQTHKDFEQYNKYISLEDDYNVGNKL